MGADKILQPTEHGTAHVTEAGPPGIAVQVSAGGHTLIADEPIGQGGNNTGPAPYDLLLAALGACTAMTVRMYANHKQWPLTHVEVFLTHEKVSVEGEEGQPKHKQDVIAKSVRVEGDLSAEQRERLRDVANKCPVHRTLQSTISLETRLAD